MAKEPFPVPKVEARIASSATRLLRLLELEAPPVVVANEGELLARRMAEYRRAHAAEIALVKSLETVPSVEDQLVAALRAILAAHDARPLSDDKTLWRDAEIAVRRAEEAGG